ncbi:SDR family oxidoreductase [Actinomadura barringtoniae]|uniref:SDR family oxidoreductase n=1 Tax=Actinomadura barringtoniae TaxID=1427535 RepID=A0A939P5F2_9ACTN|nr:SDR family NAD(P)-dependent oxidoreductase [Actinomadura barringtoniae]MBO2445571.1 SDR family oxidoreductase [Actinomadura barringtoniae]
MDLQIDGKNALVTGGTRGIGRAIVTALAENGANVTTCYRSGAEADDLRDELKGLGTGRHQVVQADVTGEKDVAALADRCRENGDGLDIVVNNVGIDEAGPIERTSLEDWARVRDTNLRSMFTVTQGMLPLLSQGASVINMGGAAALRGVPMRAAYSASKAAIIGLTRSMAKELGPNGIRVNVVTPGFVEDEPGGDGGGGGGMPEPVRQQILAMTPLRRFATSDDVAGVVLFLASDLSRYLTGATLQVDGGI